MKCIVKVSNIYQVNDWSVFFVVDLLQDAQVITIHLVGVRLAEFRNVMGWEIIAHELPELKHLNLVFIGDECPLADLPRDFTYKSKEIQQNRKDCPGALYLSQKSIKLWTYSF